MNPTRIDALLEPFFDSPNDQGLTADDLDKISTYIDLLLRWNARINLTAIRDPEQIVPRHFGESFFLARHLFPERVGRALLPAPAPVGNDRSQPVARGSKLVDIGSGAGFPALPIKIWAPEIHLTLIEANHKKAAFLREVVRALILTNVDVIAERAETVLSRLAIPCHSDRREESASPFRREGTLSRADIVTFRAIEKFDKILPLAASFLAPHGRLAVLIGSAQQSSLSALPGLRWHAEHIPQSHTRMLAIGEH